MVFKSKFVGWDDVIAVDFTRTAASVARTGADLQVRGRDEDHEGGLLGESQDVSTHLRLHCVGLGRAGKLVPSIT